MQNKTPAPSSYAITRFGDNTTNLGSSAFKSSTDRFVHKVPNVPGAGAYDQNSGFVRNKSFRIDHAKAPFESSAVRFDPKQFHDSQHLGPATYNTNCQSLAMQSLRQAVLKKTVKGGFGSTESRKFDNRSKSAGDDPNPGPGHYEVAVKHEKSDKSFSMLGSSSFSSMSHRMIVPSNEVKPSPWEYNITQYNIASKVAQPNKVRHFKKAFNSSISRTKAHRNNSEQTPGPG